jgi:hypothetical protein
MKTTIPKLTPGEAAQVPLISEILARRLTQCAQKARINLADVGVAEAETSSAKWWTSSGPAGTCELDRFSHRAVLAAYGALEPEFKALGFKIHFRFFRDDGAVNMGTIKVERGMVYEFTMRELGVSA